MLKSDFDNNNSNYQAVGDDHALIDVVDDPEASAVYSRKSCFQRNRRCLLALGCLAVFSVFIVGAISYAVHHKHSSSSASGASNVNCVTQGDFIQGQNDDISEFDHPLFGSPLTLGKDGLSFVTRGSYQAVSYVSEDNKYGTWGISDESRFTFPQGMVMDASWVEGNHVITSIVQKQSSTTEPSNHPEYFVMTERTSNEFWEWNTKHLPQTVSSSYDKQLVTQAWMYNDTAFLGFADPDDSGMQITNLQAMSYVGGKWHRDRVLQSPDGGLNFALDMDMHEDWFVVTQSSPAAVYVYNNWDYMAKLSFIYDPTGDKTFGSSVLLSPDTMTLLVGHPEANLVHVFRRQARYLPFKEQTPIQPLRPESMTLFGTHMDWAGNTLAISSANYVQVMLAQADGWFTAGLNPLIESPFPYYPNQQPPPYPVLYPGFDQNMHLYIGWPANPVGSGHVIIYSDKCQN